VYAPSEEKRDDSKDRFYKEFKQVFFCTLLKYHIKNILEDFNAKVKKECQTDNWELECTKG